MFRQALKFFKPSGVAAPERKVPSHEIEAIRSRLHDMACGHVQSLTHPIRMNPNAPKIIPHLFNYSEQRFALWPKKYPSVGSVSDIIIEVGNYAKLIEEIEKIKSSNDISELFKNENSRKLLQKAGVELPLEPTWDNFVSKVCPAGWMSS